jgi:ribosomal protein S19E (S16A)
VETKTIAGSSSNSGRPRKLTDAQVKAAEGFAKMLEQSGYRVDFREDNKIQINGKSLYDGATLQIQNRNR